MANDQGGAKQLVRQTLLAADSLQALLGDAGAIYTDHPQAPDSSAIPMPCIILDCLGGNGGYQGGFQHMNLHIYIYSRISQDQADAVYHAMYVVLHAARLVSTVQKVGGALANPAAGMAREIRRPESGWNKEVKGWFSRGDWRISTAG